MLWGSQRQLLKVQKENLSLSLKVIILFHYASIQIVKILVLKFVLLSLFYKMFFCFVCYINHSQEIVGNDFALLANNKRNIEKDKAINIVPYQKLLNWKNSTLNTFKVVVGSLLTPEEEEIQKDNYLIRS